MSTPSTRRFRPPGPQFEPQVLAELVRRLHAARSPRHDLAQNGLVNPGVLVDAIPAFAALLYRLCYAFDDRHIDKPTAYLLPCQV